MSLVSDPSLVDAVCDLKAMFASHPPYAFKHYATSVTCVFSCYLNLFWKCDLSCAYDTVVFAFFLSSVERPQCQSEGGLARRTALGPSALSSFSALFLAPQPVSCSYYHMVVGLLSQFVTWSSAMFLAE